MNRSIQLAAAIIYFLTCTDGWAIVVFDEGANDGGEQGEAVAASPRLENDRDGVPEFGYWDHVGIVGMGSGVYLGGGYVLTSAHVGCHPFRMSDGSTYQPLYSSWRILTDAAGRQGDLAVFCVNITDAQSHLARLGWLPVGELAADESTPLVMVGTGFVQRKSVSASEEGGVVLGYELQRVREKRWGINCLDKILKKPVTTRGGYQTHCFVSSFDRSPGEAQAADGDSGGAMFAYNRNLERWEIVGCIIAVSQIGSYIPFGARTYAGNLAAYDAQLPHSLRDEFDVRPETPLVVEASDEDVVPELTGEIVASAEAVALVAEVDARAPN
jgi:hypothetical protein